MKITFLAVAVLFLSTVSINANAKNVHHKHPKRKVVVISFSENEAKRRGPASDIYSPDEIAAQARHEARMASLNRSMDDLQ